MLGSTSWCSQLQNYILNKDGTKGSSKDSSKGSNEDNKDSK